MPGTIPATSQLDRLISMTAINVLAGSRAMRDRLKLFNVCMGSSIGSQRTMDAISTPPPHSIFHLRNRSQIALAVGSVGPLNIPQQFGDLAIAVAAVLPGKRDNVGRKTLLVVTTARDL